MTNPTKPEPTMMTIHSAAIDTLRATCNAKINRINRGVGTRTPGFKDINDLLKACDLLFSSSTQVEEPTAAQGGGFCWIEGEPPHDEGVRILVENDRGVFLVYWEEDGTREWCWICPDGKNDDAPLRGNRILRWAKIPPVRARTATEPPAPAGEEAAEMAGIEEWEHEDQRQLSLLYNHRADDSLQFNRTNMRVAIRHGRALASRPSSATEQEAVACPLCKGTGKERLHTGDVYPCAYGCPPVAPDAVTALRKALEIIEINSTGNVKAIARAALSQTKEAYHRITENNQTK